MNSLIEPKMKNTQTNKKKRTDATSCSVLEFLKVFFRMFQLNECIKTLLALPDDRGFV